MQLRPAVSVIEVLVALVVFSIAALGSAGTLTLSARAQRTAASRREAMAALESQAGLLSASLCADRSAGTRNVAGVRVEWTVAPSDSLLLIAIVATYRGTSETLHLEVACE